VLVIQGVERPAHKVVVEVLEGEHLAHLGLPIAVAVVVLGTELVLLALAAAVL